jgi:NodT family efflux transporter outer membrane factor (OMF) lipoprotein
MFGVRTRVLSITGLLVLLSGCMIGPKYVRPTIQIPNAYKESADWKVAQPQDEIIRGAWWKIFRDPQLDALETEVNISNQNIVIAQAQYAQALALMQAARSSFFPTLGTAASYTRSHNSSGARGNSTSLNNTSSTVGNGTLSNNTSSSNGKNAVSNFTLSANVSWELDLWGKIRRTVESNRANVQASAADLENARLSAQAQLAQDYFQLCSLDGQKKILEDTIDIFQKFLVLTKNRYAGGVAGKSDVLLAQTQLEGTQAQEIDVGVQRSQLEHAIALLLGKPASDFSIPLLTQSSTVPSFPVGLPSEILERRPDIAAAERTVASANALIGVAESAYFPTLTLSASGDYQNSNLARIFSSPNPLWSIGPALAETIFDGGLRHAQTAQAKAVYDQDVASYRQTVLTAIQQVEDNLAALRILEEEAKIQDEALKDARKSVMLETNQYKAGTVSALDVITIQATALSDEKAAVVILGERMNACVLLVQYLGGGWKASE